MGLHPFQSSPNSANCRGSGGVGKGPLKSPPRPVRCRRAETIVIYIQSWHLPSKTPRKVIKLKEMLMKTTCFSSKNCSTPGFHGRCLPDVSQVSRMSLRCLPDVSKMSTRCPRCLPDVSQRSPTCLSDVSQMTPRCLSDVSQMSPWCLWDVSKMSLRCLHDVSQMCPRCLPDVSQMCSRGLSNVLQHWSYLSVEMQAIALLRAKTSALLRRKTCAALRPLPKIRPDLSPARPDVSSDRKSKENSSKITVLGQKTTFSTAFCKIFVWWSNFCRDVRNGM